MACCAAAVVAIAPFSVAFRHTSVTLADNKLGMTKLLPRSGETPRTTRTIWLLGRPDAMISLDDQIEPYGYHIVRIDPTDTMAMQSRLSSADMVVIEATQTETSISGLVSHAATSSGRPGILVIERGLDAADRVLALEAGADDCVTWPCAPRELVARIRAIMRRRQAVAVPENMDESLQSGTDAVSFSGWVFLRAQRALVRGDGPAVALPAAEYEILDLLLNRPGCIVSRQALLGATAPVAAQDRRELRAVDLQISRLRKRLEVDGREIIRTVRGRGYMIIGEVAGTRTAHVGPAALRRRVGRVNI